MERCEAFAEALTVAGESAIELGEQIRSLKADWFERARHPNKGSTARRLIEGLVGHPVVSLESTEELLGVSNEAVRLALGRLEKAGVVRQVTIGRRNRAWAALEVFDLLDELDASARSA